MTNNIKKGLIEICETQLLRVRWVGARIKDWHVLESGRTDGVVTDKVELHRWKQSKRAAGRTLKTGQSALRRNGDGTEGSRAAASAYVLCPFIRACPCISEGRSRRGKVDGVQPEAEK